MMRKEDVLRLLKEEGHFVSGQKLAEILQVSRTAIWKTITKLKQEGYEIEAVQNLGYRLIAEDVLNESELRQALKNAGVSLEVLYKDSLDSTNRLARELAEEGGSREYLIVAGEQTKGRGRRGRDWLSPPEGGIWMSLLLFPIIEGSKIAMLTLLAALAVCEGISRTTGLVVGIKWPNDVLIAGKKVCGILTEGSLDMEGIKYIVCGIGINANLTVMDDSIKDMATSIFLETNAFCNRKELIATILTRFMADYKRFLTEKSLSFIKKRYEAYLVTKDRRVLIERPEGGFFAQAKGIDEEGALLVEDDCGKQHKIISGEVSIRGLHGYAE